MKKKFNEGKGELSIANKNGDTDLQLTPKEELAGIMDAYKIQNPAKYEAKLQRGEFDKYLEVIKGEAKAEVEEAKAEAKEEKAKK